MTQLNQTAVILTVIVVGIVLALVGLFGINNAVDSINENSASLLSGLDNSDVAASLATLAAAVNSIPSPIIDPSLCSNINGCGGQWDVDEDRNSAVQRVIDELTEDENRDLYKEIRNLVDIEDNEDFDVDNLFDLDEEYIVIHKTGEVRTNENPDFDYSETTVITIDFIIEVRYFEDGDILDLKTDYFRVQATIDDLEDGIGFSEVEIDSVNEVSRRFVLPSL